MLRARRIRTPALAVLSALGLGLLASCGESPTEPPPKAVVHRTVTVVVVDSLGAPRPDAAVFWVARFDSAGIAETRFSETDGEGADLQVLAEGPWVVSAAAAPPARVAGASFVVSGAARALADTQVVRLTLHAGSRLTGIATLAGRPEHSGTIVSTETGGFAVTDSTGAWAIGDVPLGRWPLTMYHFGFALGTAQALVTIPGSTVAVPAVNMISSP